MRKTIIQLLALCATMVLVSCVSDDKEEAFITKSDGFKGAAHYKPLLALSELCERVGYDTTLSAGLPDFASCDVVVCPIETLPRYGEKLTELQRFIRNGGLLITGLPGGYHHNRYKENAVHRTRLRKKDLPLEILDWLGISYGDEFGDGAIFFELEQLEEDSVAVDNIVDSVEEFIGSETFIEPVSGLPNFDLTSNATQELEIHGAHVILDDSSVYLLPKHDGFVIYTNDFSIFENAYLAESQNAFATLSWIETYRNNFSENTKVHLVYSHSTDNLLQYILREHKLTVFYFLLLFLLSGLTLRRFAPALELPSVIESNLLGHIKAASKLLYQQKSVKELIAYEKQALSASYAHKEVPEHIKQLLNENPSESNYINYIQAVQSHAQVLDSNSNPS